MEADIPVAVSGALTVSLIVVLGIFIYPALLRRPRGKVVVAAATVVLGIVFFVFDRSAGYSERPFISAAVLALLPLGVGALVYRLQRGKPA